MGGSKEAEAVPEERDGRAGCLSLSPGRNAVKVAVWAGVHRAHRCIHARGITIKPQHHLLIQIPIIITSNMSMVRH
jgi:hypothetical protein